MAQPILGKIELQKDPSSRFWYEARVVDVKNDTVVVAGFENDVWPEANYPVSRIRKPPKLTAAEVEKFNPAVGEEVELYVPSTEHAPAGYGPAVVRNIKHDFYFVALVSPSSAPDAIVEKDMLRPSTTMGLPMVSLQQENYKIPRDLQSWVRSEDALGCFCHIEDQSGLLMIQIMKQDLKLVGEQKSIHRAKILLQLHVKHQGQIHSFQEVLDKQLTALEKKRNRIEGVGFKHSVEFNVWAEAIPRIIGKGGENIRGLQERYDTLVSVLPEDTDSANPERTVRIFGNDVDQIERTRAEMEYVEEVMQVEPHMADWIVGRGGSTINRFKELSGLVYARLEEDQSVLRLMGLRNNVDDAKIMFESHLMYYNVFHQMDEDMEQIARQLREIGQYGALEWTWYREEDEEYGKGGDWKGKGSKRGKGGKGAAGKGGGKNEGKDWEERPKGKGKGEERLKGKGKGGKSGPTSRAAAAEEEDDYYAEEETAPATRLAKGRGGKGGKGGRQNRRPIEEEEEEEEEPEAEETEHSRPARGRGRGPTARTARPGRGSAVGSGGPFAVGGRAAAAAAALPDREPPKLGPSGRRMGKKGLRS